MITKKDWNEFRETGLLLLTNQFLHIFGWSIVVDFNENGQIESVLPARVKFRGFDNKNTEKAYIKISKYMKENSDELLCEASLPTDKF